MVPIEIQLVEIRRNKLLNMLPDFELGKLASDLQFVSMPMGMVVCESGLSMPFAYFPTSSMVSLSHSNKRGEISQIALIGCEGLAGVSVFMGGHATSNAVVMGAGMGYRISQESLLDAFNHSDLVQSLLLRYTLALMAQMSQNVICNRHHHIGQQLCSLLLLCNDRFPPNSIALTHTQLSGMLGVRREGITHAASQLQDAGVIRYVRGHIKILERQVLETLACECYGLVVKEYARSLSGNCVASLVEHQAASPPS